MLLGLLGRVLPAVFERQRRSLALHPFLLWIDDLGRSSALCAVIAEATITRPIKLAGREKRVVFVSEGLVFSKLGARVLGPFLEFDLGVLHGGGVDPISSDVLVNEHLVERFLVAMKPTCI